MKKQTRALSLGKNRFLSALLLAGLMTLSPSFTQAQTYAAALVNPFNLTSNWGALKPTFGDLDGDGDLDMLAATNGGPWGGSLIYYENIGTRIAPNYAAPVFDPYGSISMGGVLAPALVDLDNDGDLDLMMGNQSGNSLYFENTGTATNAVFTTFITNPFSLYGIGYFATHTFTDLDNDGDLDVLIGEYYGTMFYFENIGSASAPQFGAHQALPFGLTNGGYGPRPAFIDMDKDGDKDLFVGIDNGSFRYYENTGTATVPSYITPTTNPFGTHSLPSTFAAPAFADLDLDGDMDILAGDQNTQFKYFENTTPLPVPPSPANTTSAGNLLICNGTAATLSASGLPNGKLGWYDAPTGGNRLGGGSPFTTLALTGNQTFYVQDSTSGGQSPRIAVSVVVSQAIVNQNLTAAQTSFCISGSTDVILGASETGVNYTLRNELDDAAIGTTLAGTGSSLTFNTGTISATTSYNVIAKKAITAPAALTCLREMTQKVTVSIKQPATASVNKTLCYGANYTYPDGTIASNLVANATHISTLTGQAANGCDSIVTTNLTIIPAKTGTVNSTICAEESIVINGTTYNAAHPSGTEVFTNIGIYGCDSTVTINLNVLPAKTGAVTSTLCAGESITVNETVYNAAHPSGTEIFTNIGMYGCDSTVTINLNVLPVKTGSVNSTLCAGESITVNGTVYNAAHLSGTEIFTNVGPFGCDSTVTINLNVLPVKTGTVNSTLCAGESITVNGTIYNAAHLSGTEVFTNVGPFGCDSTVTINLNALPAKIGSVTETICAEESITVNGTVYNAAHPSGIEVFNNIGIHGCDSTVTVNLTVNPLINITLASNGTTITVGETGAAYQWIDCDTEEEITGATAQSFTATENGSYAVIVSKNGCENISECKVINNVGISENTSTFFALYPNPAESTFTVSGLEALSGIREIILIDLNGKRVNIMEQTTHVWDVSTINAGIYYVQIVHEKGIETIKLVKK